MLFPLIARGFLAPAEFETRTRRSGGKDLPHSAVTTGQQLSPGCIPTVSHR